MKLLFSREDIEGKLKTLLAMEGLNVTGMRWDGSTVEDITLVMDFEIKPKLSVEVEDEVVETVKKKLQLQPTTEEDADALADLLSISKRLPPQGKRNKHRKQSHPGLDEDEFIDVEHPITGMKAQRRLSNKESFEFPK